MKKPTASRKKKAPAPQAEPTSEKSAGKKLNHLLVPVLLVIAAGLYSYWNTFNVPFVFDDQSSIVDNAVIKDLSNFLAGTEGYRYNPRRFVGYLTLALNYHWGGLDVTAYHVVNLAIHLLNGLLVYALCRQIFRTPRLRESVSEPAARSIALLAALLFTAHPVQTQAVTYIVQRLTSLTTLFFLLSLVLYAAGRIKVQGTGIGDRGSGEEGQRAEDGGSKSNNGQRTTGNGQRISPITNHQSPLTAVLSFAGALLAAILAMKTKEIAFTLPIIVLLFEFSFFKSSLKTRLLICAPLLLTLCIVPLSLIGSDRPLAELLDDVDRITRETAALSRSDYLLTQFAVITKYIRLLFLPMGQNLDYDQRIHHTFFTPPVFFSAIFLAALLALAIYLYGFTGRKSKVQSHGSKVPGPGSEPRSPVPNPQSPVTDHGSRPIAFGILWFFITLAVESSVIPIRDVIFEHRVYLPSAGAFLALATGAVLLGRRLPAKAFWTIAAVVILALGTASWQRNRVWGDEVTLWRDTAEKSPGKPRPLYNLGKALLEEGRTDEAIGEILGAVRLDPDNVEARNNLGAAYDRKGWTKRAIAEFQLALRLQPKYAIARTNLGIALEKRGRTEEAIEQYRMAVRDKPKYFTAHLNLGTALFGKGLVEEAIREYRTAVKLDPGDPEARMNLAVAYDAAGRKDEAVEAYGRARELDPENTQIYNNLGVILQMQGRLEKAADQYRTALRLDPANDRTHANLGTVYLAMGRPSLAAEQFRTALRLDPENAEYAGLLKLVSGER